MSAQLFHRGIVMSALILWSSSITASEPPGPLVAHEWGTFTALEDERGSQLLGINVDTEPVPGFVHNLGRFLLNDPVLSSQHWIHRQKAVPRNHPQVSLRLETPVIYFYPPAGARLPFEVDVDVKFRGGWLTEFYPQADVHFPVVDDGEFRFTDLSPQTTGHISWHKLQVGAEGPGPETGEHVWLAPREVAAAGIANSKGEHEKYLFYRGVARQQAPLRVVTENHGESLSLNATFQGVLGSQQRTTIKTLWLMETRADGTCAYRRLEHLPVINDGQPPRRIVTSRRFSDVDFQASNRDRLEKEMQAELLQEGLFPDEAKALLSTWQQAYFVSPGLRVFYTVPREWTDYYLPLTISGSTKITRVMIGRVELISDPQRQLLTKLAQTAVSKGDWLSQFPFDSRELKNLLAGRAVPGEVTIPIPPDFQIYLDLGRFRNALVAAEEQRTRSATLTRFIRENHLEPFKLAQYSGK